MADTPPSPEPLGELFLATSRRLRHRTAHALAPLGITPHQGRTLRTIERDGPMRLGVLADALRIAPRSVTDVVDALVEAGWVARSPDPDDRRATVIEVTDAGREQARAVEEASEGVFAGLPAADRAELARILRKATDPGTRRD
jgi:DNA-binding MarR family transcriptional regulator